MFSKLATTETIFLFCCRMLTAIFNLFKIRSRMQICMQNSQIARNADRTLHDRLGNFCQYEKMGVRFKIMLTAGDLYTVLYLPRLVQQNYFHADLNRRDGTVKNVI